MTNQPKLHLTEIPDGMYDCRKTLTRYSIHKGKVLWKVSMAEIKSKEKRRYNRPIIPWGQLPDMPS